MAFRWTGASRFKAKAASPGACVRARAWAGGRRWALFPRRRAHGKRRTAAAGCVWTVGTALRVARERRALFVRCRIFRCTTHQCRLYFAGAPVREKGGDVGVNECAAAYGRPVAPPALPPLPNRQICRRTCSWQPPPAPFSRAPTLFPLSPLFQVPLTPRLGRQPMGVPPSVAGRARTTVRGFVCAWSALHAAPSLCARLCVRPVPFARPSPGRRPPQSPLHPKEGVRGGLANPRQAFKHRLTISTLVPLPLLDTHTHTQAARAPSC